MPEQAMIDAALEILKSIVQAITNNPNIWIPVLAAWAFAFVYSRWLTKEYFNRKSDREFRIYSANFIVGFLLYILFNFKDGVYVFLSEATLSGAIAVLIPAIWFNRRFKKT